MAYCEKCGTKIEDYAKFCPECGQAVEPGSTTEQIKTEPAVEQNAPATKEINPVNTTDTIEQFDKDDVEKNKVMGVLAYILFFIPLLAAKDSPFARFHANQGLVLFLGGIASSILMVIPILGWLLAPVVSIIIMVLSVIGIINALNGRAKVLPIIGKFKILK